MRLKRNRRINESNSVYEISYDIDSPDTGEAYKDNYEKFEGSWSELQEYIKQMKKNGCYNINATYEYDNEDECYEESLNEELLHNIEVTYKYKDRNGDIQTNTEVWEDCTDSDLRYGIQDLKKRGFRNIKYNIKDSYSLTLGESTKIRSIKEDLENDFDQQLIDDGFKRTAGHEYRSGYDYVFYRKLENGKGKWKAIQTDRNGNKEIIDVTYDQVRGFEPITGIEKTARFLGKKLLPQRESIKNSYLLKRALNEEYFPDDVVEIKYDWLNNGKVIPMVEYFSGTDEELDEYINYLEDKDCTHIQISDYTGDVSKIADKINTYEVGSMREELEDNYIQKNSKNTNVR